ncbi:MAG: ABC transporter ATP-binding protein [Thaumarchaeota archaeon]|jgi:ABC-2 type transport system ATP-binding protein|nr:ABC transporter ATP-binding protein [Candidatus Terraquivivens yellowstonensis]MCL7395746.1 ABC transporter ATP-binding protein [Candidatus Terraquivivens yellowstonensis]MCL7398374.1 ABC transporter ATP-binding protein [Candidatus Terraquivivens yellowstonensis]MCL7401119.1 ABC transporter ATP-binding protein [Candidatus Terraquivivens yellowstonensis]
MDNRSAFTYHAALEALSAERLVKVYGNGFCALKGITLSVDSGTIFSLLGRNGAGKTTFLRIMTTQLLPTSGTGRVLGYDIVKEVADVRKRIAVVPQESKPMYLLTVKEHVKYYLMMRGFSMSEASERTRKVLDELGLNEYSDTLCMKLSGGLKRKVLVAMAVATEADVIFLDEPTTGLDPIARRLVWDVINRAAKSGRTIFLTTHNMSEVEAIADKFALINEGELVAQGYVDEVQRMLPYKMRAEVQVTASNPEELSEFGEVIMLGRRLIVYPRDEEESKRLYEFCTERGLKISFSPVGVEDVFIRRVFAHGADEER